MISSVVIALAYVFGCVVTENILSLAFLLQGIKPKKQVFIYKKRRRRRQALFFSSRL
jgi:hypothetical protein